MKQGAIFDMDGLMFDTEAIWQEGWRIYAKEYGYEPSAEFGRKISGTSGEIMREVVRTYYPRVDTDEFISSARGYVDDCLSQSVPVKEGLIEILELFKNNGVRMAVASSSRKERIRQNLAMTNTLEYFDAVVSGQEIQNGKPEPDIFLAAAEQLSLPPQDCYVLEDSFGGVQAGHAAGCYTIMVPDQLAPTPEIRALANAVYSSLSEAAAELSRQTSTKQI